MPVSFFLAKLFGFYFLIISALLFVRKETLMQYIQSFLANTGLVMFAGILNLLAGLAIMIGHPVWGVQWELLISLLGLLMTIKGILLFGFPNTLFQWQLKFIQNTTYWNYMLGCTALFGIILTVLGCTA